jgi:preprotein translocase subunit SecG
MSKFVDKLTKSAIVFSAIWCVILFAVGMMTNDKTWQDGLALTVVGGWILPLSIYIRWLIT